MSNYLYLQCLDHAPALVATEESGQHLHDLPRIRADIAMREVLVRNLDKMENEQFMGPDTISRHFGYFTYHSAKFLRQHQRCIIGIVDEYGTDWPVEEDA